MGDISSDAIDQANFSIDRRCGGGPLGDGAYFQAAERFALLAKNISDIVAGASTKSNEHQFHGAVAGFLVTINHDGVAGSGDGVEAVVVEERGAGFSHRTPIYELRLTIFDFKSSLHSELGSGEATSSFASEMMSPKSSPRTRPASVSISSQKTVSSASSTTIPIFFRN